MRLDPERGVAAWRTLIEAETRAARWEDAAAHAVELRAIAPRDADAVLARIGRAEAGITALNSLPRWLAIPPLTGASVVNREDDRDRFFAGDVLAVSREPDAAAVGIHAPSQGIVATVLCGAAGCTRTTYDEDGRPAETTVDIDGDRRPDVRRSHVTGTDIALSGRIEIVIVDAAVGAGADPFNRADPYARIIHNGEVVARTRTIRETHFPSWGDGAVIQYRDHDTVVVEAWDEDLWFDDHMGDITFRSMPVSGTYVAREGEVPFALRIAVRPSTLPPGRAVHRSSPPHFAGDPDLRSDVTAIVNEAHAAEAASDITESVATWLAQTIAEAVVQQIVSRLVFALFL